ncbi:DUF1275 domain-containing protein [Thiotrichales bacterium 19X7-9]|nr:DUF1275 domain-containing protein [Thiotrichales bacterium 19X7-9]
MFRKDLMINLIIQFIFTAVAGWADTAGFLIVAHVFVSFMSGNSTQLMVALVQNNLIITLTMIVVITGFVFGVIIGEIVRHKVKRRFTFIVLLLESIALWLVILFVFFNDSKFFFLPIFSFAMGLHNTSLYKENSLLVKTYISGTLVSLGQAIAKACVSRENLKLVLNPLIVFIGFVIGAITGALISNYISHLISLIVLASMVSFMMLCSIFIRSK